MKSTVAIMPEANGEPAEIEPTDSYALVPVRPPTAVLEPSRAIHRLAAPDAELPYTLEGTVMSMDLIKELYSVWNDGSGSVRVGMIIPIVRLEVRTYPDMYLLLKESMETYGQRAPIHISYPGKAISTLAPGPMLTDGIHRVAIAEELGWETMITSDQQIRWHEWDESEMGLKYRYLWEKRLGMHK